MKTASQHMRDAHERAEGCIAAIDAALEAGVEPYQVESLRFLRAETKVTRRRIENLLKLMVTRAS